MHIMLNGIGRDVLHGAIVPFVLVSVHGPLGHSVYRRRHHCLDCRHWPSTHSGRRDVNLASVSILRRRRPCLCRGRVRPSQKQAVWHYPEPRWMAGRLFDSWSPVRSTAVSAPGRLERPFNRCHHLGHSCRRRWAPTEQDDYSYFTLNVHRANYEQIILSSCVSSRATAFGALHADKCFWQASCTIFVSSGGCIGESPWATSGVISG